MEFVLEKIVELSGSGANIYSFRESDAPISRFESFLVNNAGFPEELKSIVSRLITIGHRIGADEQFFKLNEGNPGDGVCALFDLPEKNLRLYCIRFGRVILIVGGGGKKPKNIRSFQEDDTLTQENYLLRRVSLKMVQMIKDKEIKFNSSFTDFSPDSNFSIILDDDE